MLKRIAGALLTAALLSFASVATARAGDYPLDFESTPVPINVSTATTVKLVSAATAKRTFITGWYAVAAGVTNVTLVYGNQTTTPCDTNTHSISGPMALVANDGLVVPIVENVPNGFDVCLTSSGAVQVGGSLNFFQK